MQCSVLVGDRYVHAPCVDYTHTFHHTSPILSLIYWKAQCMNALHTMHHHFLFDHLHIYTLTWYSSSPLCEHRIIHRYVTYGLVCLYTSHICRLMPTHTAIFIVHVCGNALHIGTVFEKKLADHPECLYSMSKLNCRMCT